jgi:diaminohydroxyphosphoribosylaminopyrimidine deaminase/5-amino-6-(5-phosphoribosylamino)uracil reductase
VIFDRNLRTPPTARVLSTLEAGPVIIVTKVQHAAAAGVRDALEARGAQVDVIGDGALRPALRRLAERDIGSLLLEGGAALHAAAWDEGVVDYVRLYVTPHLLGSAGVALLPDRAFASTDLHERRVAALGPDVLIEGYVHRPG